MAACSCSIWLQSLANDLIKCLKLTKSQSQLNPSNRFQGKPSSDENRSLWILHVHIHLLWLRRSHSSLLAILARWWCKLHIRPDTAIAALHLSRRHPAGLVKFDFHLFTTHFFHNIQNANP